MVIKMCNEETSFVLILTGPPSSSLYSCYHSRSLLPLLLCTFTWQAPWRVAPATEASGNGRQKDVVLTLLPRLLPVVVE